MPFATENENPIYQLTTLDEVNSKGVSMKPNVKSMKDITHDADQEEKQITVLLDWLITNNDSKIEPNMATEKVNID